MCTKRVWGKFQDRIYRTDHADKFDVAHCGFFINSSLAQVLRFRRRLASVHNVPEGIRANGFSDTRMTALVILSQEAYGVLLLPLHSKRIDCCLSPSCIERSLWK